MAKTNPITLCAMLFAQLLIQSSLSAEELYLPVPDSSFAGDILPATRIGLQYRTAELDQHKFYHRIQTLAAFGEFAFNENVSVSANAPWSRDSVTDKRTYTRYDNMGLGIHFAGLFTELALIGGLNASLPTGKEERRIGSKRIFNLEPYGGVGYFSDPFSVSAIIKYNSQANKSLKEDPKFDDDFKRTWIGSVNLGLTYRLVDVLLDYQYKYTYDPNQFRLSTHVIAPGVNLKLDDFVIGLSVPYTLSRNREYNWAGIVRAYARF